MRGIINGALLATSISVGSSALAQNTSITVEDFKTAVSEIAKNGGSQQDIREYEAGVGGSTFIREFASCEGGEEVDVMEVGVRNSNGDIAFKNYVKLLFPTTETCDDGKNDDRNTPAPEPEPTPDLCGGPCGA